MRELPPSVCMCVHVCVLIRPWTSVCLSMCVLMREFVAMLCVCMSQHITAWLSARSLMCVLWTSSDHYGKCTLFIVACQDHYQQRAKMDKIKGWLGQRKHVLSCWIDGPTIHLLSPTTAWSYCILSHSFLSNGVNSRCLYWHNNCLYSCAALCSYRFENTLSMTYLAYF